MSYPALNHLVSRMRHQIRLHGVRGMAVKGGQRIRKLLYLDETHIWYELVLDETRPRLKPRPGLELVRGSEQDLPLLDEFPSISGPGAKVWLETGAIFWLLLDGEKPVFVCWVFQSPARFEAAQGWLALPPGVALMEESAVSPSYRGRGTLAPAVWSQVADRLKKAGVASLITKVEHDNKVMRWSLAKAGFRETFTVHFRRLGPVSRTTIRSADNTRVRWLAEQTGARVTSNLT